MGERYRNWLLDQRACTVLEEFGVSTLDPWAQSILEEAAVSRLPRGAYKIAAETLAPYTGSMFNSRSLITAMRVVEEGEKMNGVRVVNQR